MKIGVIGGPFYWNLWQLEAEKFDVKTPYGNPADSLFKGKVGQHDVITLLRHGNGNTFSPSDLPYLANVYAMGTFKPDFIMHVSACGSLDATASDNIKGSIFLFDQLIDFTKSRPATFGKVHFGKVQHLDFGSPTSPELTEYAHQTFLKHNIAHQFKGTLISEEGPRYSTAAEAKMYRLWGANAVNHTACPEVYLIRELGIPVLGMSLITNVVRTDSVIESDEITASIQQFRNAVPSAVKTLIENLPETFKFRRPKLNDYDVSRFDHR